MLNVRLGPETEAYLLDIAEREKTTPEVLLKSLIHQHWNRLHLPKDGGFINAESFALIP